jgi:predicted Co/Zn/Cd cation transporter (cation efflux family)
MTSKHNVENFVKKEKEIVPYLIMLFLLYYVGLESYEILTGKRLLDIEWTIASGLGFVVICFMMITIFIISSKYPTEYKEYQRYIKKNYDLKSFKRTLISLLGVILLFAVIAFFELYIGSWNIEFLILIFEGSMILLLGLYFIKSLEKVSN